MEKRDYLLDQIESFGRGLAQLLAQVLRTSGPGKTEFLIDETSQTLKDELDLKLSDLMAIPPQDFVRVLTEEKKVREQDLSLMADLFYELADGLEAPDHSVLRTQLFHHALALYEHLDRTSTTYSFERPHKIGHIQAYLMSIGEM